MSPREDTRSRAVCEGLTDGPRHVAGPFGSIGGEIRNSLAALDAATGTASAWNPKSDGPVEALAVTQQSVYAGGGSGLTGFLTRLDPETGATTWDLKANGPVGRSHSVAGRSVRAASSDP
jgi:outer membrane protein assembly factor BamB